MNEADKKAWAANAANTMEQFRMDTGAVIAPGGKTDPERKKGSTFTPSPKSRAKRRTGAQFAR